MTNVKKHTAKGITRVKGDSFCTVAEHTSQRYYAQKGHGKDRTVGLVGIVKSPCNWIKDKQYIDPTVSQGRLDALQMSGSWTPCVCRANKQGTGQFPRKWWRPFCDS